eukprot:s1185_g2.t1
MFFFFLELPSNCGCPGARVAILERRIDSVDFQELLRRLEEASGEPWPPERGLRLLAMNADIFVQYSSRC